MFSVGVVGLGIGNQHALAVLDNAYCQLTHLCDLDEEKVIKFKHDHSMQKIRVSSFEELLLDNSLDIISIASFDDCHFQQALKAARAGKHVFVEKPLCQTWDQLTLLHEEFRHKQLVLMSNLVLRTSELFKYVSRLVMSGDLGDIFYFEGDYLYGRLHKITEGWRKNVPNYSVMEGGGIHMIDLMVNLTGQKPEFVSSVSNKIVTADSSFNYHDFHSSVFHFASGLIAKITANFGCAHPHQHVVKVYGTKGTFIYDDQGARLFEERGDNVKSRPIHYKAKPEKKGLLIHEFVRMVMGNDMVNAQKEFDLMSMVIASDEALKYDNKIEIKYLSTA